MTDLEFDIEDQIPDEPAPSAFEYACEVCGTELTYGGRGRKPRFCDEHKSGSKGTTTRRAASGKNAQLAQQAADVLSQANAMIALALNLPFSPLQLPVTSATIVAADEGFNEQARRALLTDPKLAAMLLRGGGVSGKIGLVVAYGMLAGAIVPVAMLEMKEREKPDGVQDRA